MLNLNLGRSIFFAGGTKEIKLLSNKPDLRGYHVAEIRDLTTGKKSRVPVKLGTVKRDYRDPQAVRMGIEICA